MIYKVSRDEYGEFYIAGTVDSLPPLPSEFPMDTEATGLDIWNSHLISVQVFDGDSAYVMTDGFERLVPYLADPNYLKILHNTQYDASWYKKEFGVDIVRQFDTMIAERVLTAGKNQPADLSSVAFKYLDLAIDKDERRSMMFSDYFSSMSEKQIIYAGKDVFPLGRIKQAQSVALKRDGLVETAKLEFALTPVLVAMQVKGIGFDTKQWASVQANSRRRREEKLVELLKFFPEKRHSEDLFGDIVSEFNPASSTQLTKALKGIGIEVEDVSEVTLKRYLRDHGEDDRFRELLTSLLSFRNANSSANLKLHEHVNPKTGRIHGTPKQLGARSGRLSFEDPNLQNIETTEDIRSCFVAALGREFADIDLSQIELVTMAELSGDKNMMDAVRRGEDMHTATAKILFNTNEPTKQQRQIAKGCNFAAVFCASADTFSVSAGIPLDTADKYLKMYHEKFPSIRQFSDAQVAQSVSRGYSLNVGGRRRYIDDTFAEKMMEELVARNPNMARLNQKKLRQIALERNNRAMLTNNPVQSTAADILKRSLVEGYKICSQKNVDIVLTVHDEIILEGDKGSLEPTAQAVKSAMESAGSYYLKQLPVKAVLAPLSERWHK